MFHLPQKLVPFASDVQEHPAAQVPGEHGAAHTRTHSWRQAPSRRPTQMSPGAHPSERIEPQLAPPHPQLLHVATTTAKKNRSTSRAAANGVRTAMSVPAE